MRRAETGHLLDLRAGSILAFAIEVNELKALTQFFYAFIAFGDEKTGFVAVLFLLQRADKLNLCFRNFLHILQNLLQKY